MKQYRQRRHSIMEIIGIVLVTLLFIVFILTAQVISSYRKAKAIGEMQYRLQLLKLNETIKS